MPKPVSTPDPGSRLARGNYSFGPLYDLLFKRLPGYHSVQGILAVPKLAKEIHRSHAVLYEWLNNNRITPDGANRLVKVSKGALSHADFIPFLFTS